MKKEYKKILVNGEKIQNEKGDIEKENEIWFNQLLKQLKKHNIDTNKNLLVKLNNEKYEIFDFSGILDYIASKNLPMIYLNNNNNVEFVNDYLEKIEIIKALEKDEANIIWDNLNEYCYYTKSQLIELNIIEG